MLDERRRTRILKFQMLKISDPKESAVCMPSKTTLLFPHTQMLFFFIHTLLLPPIHPAVLVQNVHHRKYILVILHPILCVLISNNTQSFLYIQ